MPALQLMALFALKNQRIANPKLSHMKNLYERFPDFNFDIDEDLFHDASQDAATLSGK